MGLIAFLFMQVVLVVLAVVGFQLVTQLFDIAASLQGISLAMKRIADAIEEGEGSPTDLSHG
jgi:Tfp pilus assembly protein PilX